MLQHENIGKEKCVWKLTDHSKMQSKCEQTLLCKQHYVMPAILQQKHWVARSIMKGPHISGLALQTVFSSEPKGLSHYYLNEKKQHDDQQYPPPQKSKYSCSHNPTLT